jgi:hypothetical protein
VSDPCLLEGKPMRSWLDRAHQSAGETRDLIRPGRRRDDLTSLLLWPDDEERSRLPRSASVSHFYRRLPEGWERLVDDPAWQQRQQEARERAWSCGCDLPERSGLTFVRDFERGGGRRTDGAPRSVRSAGLLRLAITLRLQGR